MKQFVLFALAALTLGVSGAPIAHNDPFVSVDGVVAELHFGTTVSRGDKSHSFRVVLAGAPKMCGNAWTYAYLNEKENNYQALVAALVHAKATKSPVTVGSFADDSGYCVIRYLIVK